VRYNRRDISINVTKFVKLCTKISIYICMNTLTLSKPEAYPIPENLFGGEVKVMIVVESLPVIERGIALDC